MFDYNPVRVDDDESGYRFGTHAFRPGEYVSMRDDDGEMHTFHRRLGRDGDLIDLRRLAALHRRRKWPCLSARGRSWELVRMRALTVEPGRANSIRLEEVPPPPESDGDILVRALALGICGTDREIIKGDYGWAPSGAAASHHRP